MDTIVSIDVETVGLIPGQHSIISLGAVAFVEHKEHSEFYDCLEELPDLERDISVMAWWRGFPEKYNDIVAQQKPAKEVILSFVDWIKNLPKPVVLAADPTPFDLAFVYYYCYRFLGSVEFQKVFRRCNGIDIKTVLMTALDREYSKVQRDFIPANWTNGLKVTHNALDDARQQGHVLMHALDWIDNN